MTADMVDALFDPAVVEDPHPYLDRLREIDPVHHIAGTDAYLITSRRLIQHVVANTGTFSSASTDFLHLTEDRVPELRPPGNVRLPAGMGDEGVLAVADPPTHTRQRKVLHRVLNTAAIAAREDEFRQLIDAALDEHLPTGRVEWMHDVAEPLPIVMVGRLLGLADESATVLKEFGYASIELISGFVTEARTQELFGTMMELGPQVAEMSRRAIEETDRTTVFGVCAQAVADGEMTEGEALGTLNLIVTAGGESTTSLLGAAARALAEDHDLQAQLRSDPSLIPNFVEEVLRIEPSFKGHYRIVTEDTTLAGVDLPAGARLVLMWPAANRDPEAFPDPMEIQVDRPKPRQHMGFGAGMHLCIGAPLARLEARVTIEQMLARTTSFAVDPSVGGLHHHQSLMVRRLVELPLTLDT